MTNDTNTNTNTHTLTACALMARIAESAAFCGYMYGGVDYSAPNGAEYRGLRHWPSSYDTREPEEFVPAAKSFLDASGGEVLYRRSTCDGIETATWRRVTPVYFRRDRGEWVRDLRAEKWQQVEHEFDRRR